MMYRKYLSGVEASEASSLLPTQFFANTHTEDEPLRRLMLAILIDAVRCYRRNFRSQQPHRQVEFDEARQWLFHDNPLAPFSLVNVCSVLSIDARAVRTAIIRWTRQKIGVRGRGPSAQRPASPQQCPVNAFRTASK